jgi:hypothetical protein
MEPLLHRGCNIEELRDIKCPKVDSGRCLTRKV